MISDHFEPHDVSVFKIYATIFVCIVLPLAIIYKIIMWYN